MVGIVLMCTVDEKARVMLDDTDLHLRRAIHHLRSHMAQSGASLGRKDLSSREENVSLELAIGHACFSQGQKVFICKMIPQNTLRAPFYNHTRHIIAP